MLINSEVRAARAHTMFVLFNCMQHYKQDKCANLWVGTIISQVQTVVIPRILFSDSLSFVRTGDLVASGWLVVNSM